MTRYYKESTKKAVETAVITLVGLAMLIGPLWILQANKSNDTLLLWTISGFVVAFALLLSSVTVARPFETLAVSRCSSGRFKR